MHLFFYLVIRLLVATPSNSAADLITERLLDAGDLEQGDLLRMVGYHYLEQGRIAASIVPYAAVPDVKAINVTGLSGSSRKSFINNVVMVINFFFFYKLLHFCF